MGVSRYYIYFFGSFIVDSIFSATAFISENGLNMREVMQIMGKG